MSEYQRRLEQFLVTKNLPISNIEQITGDASIREYFRIDWYDGRAVACVYPEPFDPLLDNYIDVTRLFLVAGLPVAEIYDHGNAFGVIVQEDLGDQIMLEYLSRSDETTRSRRLDEAISLIARIQAATGKAFELNSVASRLKFDTEKLLWELDYFKEHYFGSYQKRSLSAGDEAKLDAEFEEISTELEACASVLCHRDLHAANIMIDSNDKMRLIDHQDARIGSPTYDLVSLLLDRITEPPSPEWLADKRRFFLDLRRKLGLAKIDEAAFADEFRLQAIQRCLKAVGTFSYQAAVRGKTHYILYIKPMFRISLRVAGSLGRFPAVQEILHREIG
jgi:aminoglycoside/choline kinase family phosphotransferase